MLKLAPDGLMVVDAQGRIRLANARSTTSFGYPRDEPAGHSVARLVLEPHCQPHRSTPTLRARS
ncbi:MAG: PAS domain-containing protein [Verrucomicrobia bacterium]|nr:PAS domain-containing protein [Verrucomicrobiota bacterium]